MAKKEEKKEYKKFDAEEMQVNILLEKVMPLCLAEKKLIYDWYLIKSRDGRPKNWYTGDYYNGNNEFFLGCFGVTNTITDKQLTKVKDSIVGLPADLPVDLYKMVKQGKMTQAEADQITAMRKEAYLKYETETGKKLPEPKRYPLKKDGKPKLHKDGTPVMVPITYPISFWKVYEYKDKDTGEPILDDNGKPKVKFTSLFYEVYDVNDIENYDFNLDPPAELKPFTEDEEAERVINNYIAGTGVTINHAEKYTASCYRPSTDSVHLSLKGCYTSSERYYEVALHELSHSTGAKGRLCRKGIVEPTTFGTKAYAYEEMVVEFSAMFGMKELGINGVYDYPVAYVKSWWKNASENPKDLAKACKDGYKAYEYLFSFSRIVDGVEEEVA